MTIYAYRFTTHWITTDQEITGYIERFEVQPENLQEIEDGDPPELVLSVEDHVE